MRMNEREWSERAHAHLFAAIHCHVLWLCVDVIKNIYIYNNVKYKHLSAIYLLDALRVFSMAYNLVMISIAFVDAAVAVVVITIIIIATACFLLLFSHFFYMALVRSISFSAHFISFAK